MCLHSSVGRAAEVLTQRIKSINWPAANILVLIAQLVEHCRATAEAKGSNHVGVRKTSRYFSG